MSDLGFDPTPVRVRRGGTVIWENAGGSSHEVVDDTGLDLFGLPLEPAAFGTHTFVSAGRYRYACAAHPALSGSVSVPITVSPVKGSRSTFDVTWASASAPDGYVYDVQVRRPGGRWRLWKDDVTRTGARFVADSGTGTYRFRARMVRIADAAHARWSVDDAIHVDR